jgi:hypothetical protein
MFEDYPTTEISLEWLKSNLYYVDGDKFKMRFIPHDKLTEKGDDFWKWVICISPFDKVYHNESSINLKWVFQLNYLYALLSK